MMPGFDNEHLIRELVYSALSNVIDPELGINIVDLGLVYDVSIQGEQIKVAMTLTTPACPMGNQLVKEARQVLMATIDSTAVFDIQLVWEPLWTTDRLSSEARQLLGWK